ncbi:MAG: hypothetical protein ACR2QJ_08630 [Geminicoccaceae bacterium]
MIVRTALPRMLFLGVLSGLAVLGWACSQSSVTDAKEIKAFPGALGHAASAIGGRGGAVIEVTNLNDGGAGSLRDCIGAVGPRTCVFRVAGYIDLLRPLEIRNPYIRIAGQTAPEGGITLRAGPGLTATGFLVRTHDVVLQFMRVRPGKGDFDGIRQSGDALGLRDGAHKVILDHLSLSWGNDEVLSSWTRRGPVGDVTISNNLVAEGLNYAKHGVGILIGSDYDDACNDSGTVDLVRNLVMSHTNRFPYAKIAKLRIINNIFYNWSKEATRLDGGVHVDIVGNYYRRGPSTTKRRKEVIWSKHALVMDPEDWNCMWGPRREPKFHIAGNRGPNQDMPDQSNWRMMERVDNGSAPSAGDVGRQYESPEPILPSPFPIAIHPVDQLEDRLLDGIGASKRLDSLGKWVPSRDAVDDRLLREYRENTGSILRTECDVGCFPKLAAGTPYADGDKDGMADRWEQLHGLDINDADDRNDDPDGDGYTNLEEFLNGTLP